MYPALKTAKKTGSERFLLNGDCLPFDLLSFWQWSSSDLVSNALRGVLAEYIVTIAVSSKENIRTEWDAYDVETPEGIKVEVKSGAYIQSWSQEKLSTIQFGIEQTQGWDARTNTYSTKRKRQADVYVFCVLTHKKQNTINPLDLDQWIFYVISTSRLTEAVAAQKTISLSSLLRVGPREVTFHQIHEAIIDAASNNS